jgi:ketosteroid isomerase-like protein
MDDAALRGLLDRQAIEDTLYKYAATIDLKDYDGLRTVFTDDVVAQYAGAPEIRGADTLVSWIREMSTTQGFQHHLINVYEVEIDGDEARTYTYHTSHQVDQGMPDAVYLIVGRYRDVLRRVGDRWLIADKRMEVGWMEQRRYSQTAAVAAEAEQNLAAQARSGVES